MVAGLLWVACFGVAVNRANWVTAGSMAGAVAGGFATDGFTRAAVLAVEVDCLTGAAGTGAGFGAAMPIGGDGGGSGAGANVTTRS